MSALEPEQKLVYAILEFLNDSIKDGTVCSNNQESLECIVSQACKCRDRPRLSTPQTIPTDGQRLDATIKSIDLLSEERNPTVEKVTDCGVVNQFDKYLRSPHSMIQGLLRHLNAAPCSVARAKFIVISCTNHIQNPPGF
ncbi:hypothetical protein Pst134EA_002476 [Puccinia striiformis f. sp. tritici]|uniref:hypothetical protein n=1 Tax=Puccinia striiformis f. sp. tritici TaxID=168172 RepID=UPI002008226E|nr:hypothetical protein Pst134EA_002476 [Puccinia striiformis f. sp. tritici]KAH9464065.1 hypothetical protein Pst134EB_003602 [Puccinia striiformis f. sp. tritici]KAH9471843.1 hypothetical protein Pst134EA_002476 [Puccinia striiformis f. sp. tritici]